MSGLQKKFLFTLAIVFLEWAIPGLFSLFSSFQYTVDIKKMFNKYIFFCQWLDLNHRLLVSEVTTLPTEPRLLPALAIVKTIQFKHIFETQNSNNLHLPWVCFQSID